MQLRHDTVKVALAIYAEPQGNCMLRQLRPAVHAGARGGLCAILGGQRDLCGLLQAHEQGACTRRAHRAHTCSSAHWRADACVLAGWDLGRQARWQVPCLLFPHSSLNQDAAGQQEQVAAARAFGIKIAVYQAGQPCWIIAAPQSAGCPKVPSAAAVLSTVACICAHATVAVQDARLVHVSYHDGDHYNSVRSSEDSMSGLPLPVPESCCAAFSGAPVPPEAQQAAEEKKVSQVCC